ncbi:glycine cleavage system aminomethyltransferase GcvT [Carnobacterium gallinarum]|uniref:glycine cleavage system aminomethyltransferase GcvT n=1 Tax=Carnobacterium gallinarum TaxID=2749 RepID=UPI00055434E4|nr:glycine cleavage system aminomethyltransferase GcvT [Carnobacterium gallinarum]
MELKTPLYQNHLEAKGKLVNFANYLLPIQYPTGVLKEHLAVRKSAGLFDVSHMGELVITGKDALKNMNQLFSNNFTTMVNGQVRYSLMCNHEGGILDDVIVYRYTAEKYMVVVNAANHAKDVAWIQKQLIGNVTLTDVSEEIALLALQGPKAKAILSQLVVEKELPEKYYTFKEKVQIGDIQADISQTGYTGETGYEIYLANKDAATIWRLLLEKGEAWDLIPCGLGARDTLRLEAGMPLYGHEMDETITPFETSLNFAVKMQKIDFIGKKALEKKGEPTITRVGLKVVGRGIIREDTHLYVGDQQVGKTTSGTQAPYLGYPIAMALIDSKYQLIGTVVEADVRGRRIEAELVALPFYKKER